MKYNEIVKDRNLKNESYREGLKNGNISINRFLFLTNEIKIKSKEQISFLNSEKIKIKQEFSFRGRSSFHFWLFVFGLVTALFYFACKSLFDEISKGSNFKHQLVSISGIIVSGFWFTHLLFYTQKDFGKNTYFFTILGIGVLFSMFTYFLVKYYTYKDQVILNLLGFIGRVKFNYFREMSVKAMYSEKTGEVLKTRKPSTEIMNEFDADLLRSTKGL